MSNTQRHKLNLYSDLASVLSYPTAEYRTCVDRIERNFTADFPEAGNHFKCLSQYVTSAEPVRIEETYTSTFDINAACHLDVGYQLFGEDYKRGALLVELSRVHREAGSATGTELADHLPTLLRILPRMKDDEERRELVRRLILPAIEKMISSFSESSQNIYRGALCAVRLVLERDFGSKIDFPVQPDYSAQIEEVMNA